MNTALSTLRCWRGIQAHPLSASIVTSAVGSEAFNEQLSGMTQLGYPMIVIPSMLMMMAVVH